MSTLTPTAAGPAPRVLASPQDNGEQCEMAQLDNTFCQIFKKPDGTLQLSRDFRLGVASADDVIAKLRKHNLYPVIIDDSQWSALKSSQEFSDFLTLWCGGAELIELPQFLVPAAPSASPALEPKPEPQRVAIPAPATPMPGVNAAKAPSPSNKYARFIENYHRYLGPGPYQRQRVYELQDKLIELKEKDPLFAKIDLGRWGDGKGRDGWFGTDTVDGAKIADVILCQLCAKDDDAEKRPISEGDQHPRNVPDKTNKAQIGKDLLERVKDRLAELDKKRAPTNDDAPAVATANGG